MEASQNNKNSQACLVCIQKTNDMIVLAQCSHTFCKNCIKQYIDTLKTYNILTPQKLICLQQGCSKQLSDKVIQTLYPGQEGFVLTVVRKRYKQSKDPAIKIFNCKGFTKQNRQPLVDKPSHMNRDEHSKLMNQKVKKILRGQEIEQNKKICTNILSFNKFSTKDKFIQCYVCGVTYCPGCEDFFHEGKCQKNQKQQSQSFKKFNLNKSSTLKNSQNNQLSDPQKSLQAYLNANSIAKCLNPKCGLAIQKQQGCYWVKCRCSWQFCYPCQKVWGDCQHFSKYPYKKFVPPPEWMVKALNLY